MLIGYFFKEELRAYCEEVGATFVLPEKETTPTILQYSEEAGGILAVPTDGLQGLNTLVMNHRAIVTSPLN